MKIKEMNVAIAKMMGLEVVKDLGYRSPIAPSNAMCCMAEELRFHSDWNWIMKALEWLEKQGYQFEIYPATVKIIHIEPIYRVVEYFHDELINNAFDALYQFSQHLKTAANAH